MEKEPNTSICFVLSHLPQGGAERQTINLIRMLNGYGYRITLVLYASTEIFYREVLDLPIKVLINKSTGTNRLVRNLINGLYLRRVLRQNDYDIIHTLLFHNGFWVRMLAPAKYTGRIVYSIRNDLQDASGFYLFFERLLVRRSFVTTNSLKVMAQYLNLVGKRYNDRTINIYNGFDGTKFLSDTGAPITGKVIIGTAGRQNTQKNQIQILEAIKQLHERHPLHFFLIGDMSQDKAVENNDYVQAQGLMEVVTVLDAQPHIELFYRKFNIFILSSVYESCPNALFEAMLSKCLCIVSEGANSDNFIHDGVNGLVYNGTVEMLVSKLALAIELIVKDKHQEMIERAQKYALDNFSIESMAEAYKKLYDNILS